MGKLIRKVWVVINLIILTPILAIPTIIIGLIDWRKRFAGFFPGIWSRYILWTAGIKVKVSGLENLTPGQQYIFVNNHSSMLDIPIGQAYLPGTVAFMAKKSLFNIPFFGWGLHALGCIPVDRSNRLKAQRSVDNAIERMKKTVVSIALYPEGTRTHDGELLPFKSGGFVLAIRTGLPVVPIVTHGAFEALPRGGLNLTPQLISFTIGEPMETTGLTDDDRNDLKDRVYERVSAMYEAGRPLPSS